MRQFNHFLAAATLVAGMALPLAAQDQAPAARPASTWSHDRSGLTLPATLAGFTRGESTQFDENGYNVGVSFTDAETRSTATLFVYRAGPESVPIWADRAVAGMFANPALADVSVEDVRFSRFNAPNGAGALSGLRVVTPAKGEMSATGLAIYLHDGWLVKLRMSTKTLDRAALELRIKDFVAALAMPAATRTAPAYVDLADCAQPMARGKPAKLARLDMMGLIMLGATMSAVHEKRLKEPAEGKADAAPAPLWCRDAASRIEYGVYRQEGVEDAFLVALGDGGTSLMVGRFETDGIMRSGKSFMVTQSDGVTSASYPPFDRIPLPEQVAGLPGNVAPVFSAGLLGDNKGSTIIVPSN